MADVNVPYDAARRVGGLSMNKVTVSDGEGGEKEQFQIWSVYECLKDGVVVPRLKQEKCLRLMDWDDVPQNIKASLIAMNAFEQTAIDEDAGLV